MTLATTSNRTPHVGNGTVKIYAYLYKAFTAEELVVCIATDLGVEFPPLVINTDYTVSGVLDPEFDKYHGLEKNNINFTLNITSFLNET